MNITVVGAGFVGLTTGIALGERGHQIALVEVDANRRERLSEGVVPFHEPGVPAAFSELKAKGRIHVHAHVRDAPPADVVFLCVGTPSRPDGSANLAYLEAAARDIAKVTEERGDRPVVITKSTVPPGTNRGVVLPQMRATLGEPGERYGIASNPEFLREGSALRDAREPDRVVVGVSDPLAESRMRELYGAEKCPLIVTTLETAELIKYAANGMLATRIAFANEIANLAQRTGVDIDQVMHAVGLDDRIGPKFLRAGPGFGGSCFPKDLAALAHLGRVHDAPLGILEAVLANNEVQPRRVVDLARKALGGNLNGKRIALLGVAFKPDTSDVRETRAQPIHEGLQKEGAQVVCYDPHALTEFDALVSGVVKAPTARDALEGADLAILHTEWPEFVNLPPSAYAERMRTPVVLDTRRVLDRHALAQKGVRCIALGVGETTPQESP